MDDNVMKIENLYKKSMDNCAPKCLCQLLQNEKRTQRVACFQNGVYSEVKDQSSHFSNVQIQYHHTNQRFCICNKIEHPLVLHYFLFSEV